MHRLCSRHHLTLPSRTRWAPPSPPLARRRGTLTAIILSSSSDIVSLGGGRRCNGRYKPLPRPVLEGAAFLLGRRHLQQRLAILVGKLLVVGDDLGQFVGRQHAFQLRKSLRRALLDNVEHDVDALAAIALD